MRWMRVGVQGVVLAAVALSVLGCATGGQTPPAPPVPGNAQVISVGLREFALDLSRTTVPSGAYTLIAEQRGQASHALSIEGPGIKDVSTPVIQPGGGNQQLMVMLQPGTYELWCPVGRHREQGMEATLTVR